MSFNAGLQGVRNEACTIPVSEACTPLDCRGVEVGWFSPPSPSEFVPDQRPGKVINLFGGHSCTNEIGLGGIAPWWADNTLESLDSRCDDLNYLDDGCIWSTCASMTYQPSFADDGIPDPINELLDRLDLAYDAGWRRIMLNRPVGYAPPDMSNWWTMPEWKRNGIMDHIRPWINARLADSISVSIYTGFLIFDPCATPDVVGYSSWIPRSYNSDDMCQVYTNLKPWIDAGISEFSFDNAGTTKDGKRSKFLRVAGSPDYKGVIRTGGEAMPHESGMPVVDAIRRVPWLALQRFYEHPRFPSGPPDLSSISPKEVSVAFHEPTVDCDTVRNYVMLGYVPWAWKNDVDIDSAIATACGSLSTACVAPIPACPP